MSERQKTRPVGLPTPEKCPLCGNPIVQTQIEVTRLTERQIQVLQAIASHMQVYRQSPSLREITNAIGVKAIHATSCHLQALKRKGVVKAPAGKTRGVRITPLGYQILTQISQDQWKKGTTPRKYFEERKEILNDQYDSTAGCDSADT
jgi:SOS-response transcriptional repressor LexA